MQKDAMTNLKLFSNVKLPHKVRTDIEPNGNTAPASDGGLRHYHFLSRLASVGLISVLVVMVCVGVSMATRTERLTRTASVPVRLSDLYSQARYLAGQEESLERKYRLEPSVRIADEYEETGARLKDCLIKIRAIGDAVDRKKVDEVIVLQDVYQTACREMFADIAENKADQSVEIDHNTADPAIDQIQNVISLEAVSDHNEAIAAMEDLKRIERQGVRVTQFVFVAGMALSLMLIFVLRSYRRRLDVGIKAEITRLEKAGRTDFLTGLGNHRAFHEGFIRLAAMAQSRHESMGLAVLDVDEFKVINDSRGHGSGDQVLRVLAELLTSDPANHWHRLGGDEFGLLLPAVSAQAALTEMERIRECAANQLGGTISIGLAFSKPDCSDLETLQERADIALYEAKRRGRNTVVIADDAMVNAVIVTPAKAHAMRSLLATKRVTVAFQPIWNATTGCIFAFEALARPDVEYGFQGPQEVFDIAERMGHASELDRLFRQAALARANELPGDALLFINVLPESLDPACLTDAQLMEDVESAGILPSRVVIELTERSIKRLNVIVREVQRLQSMGFKLALDDTGSGNSGLEMLSRLSVDVIKIDRGVLIGAMTDVSARGVLAGIMAIARETHTSVVVEGIETPDMMDMLRRFWADSPAETDPSRHPVRAIQGYLLGYPSVSLPTPSDIESSRTIICEAQYYSSGSSKLETAN